MEKEIMEAKRDYIARLGLLMASDRRSQVKMARYVSKGHDEYAEITFLAGHTVAVDITGDSCAGIYKDVGRAVYGR